MSSCFGGHTVCLVWAANTLELSELYWNGPGYLVESRGIIL